MSLPSTWSRSIRAGYRDMVKTLTANALKGDHLAVKVLAALTLLTDEDLLVRRATEGSLTADDVKEHSR